MLTSFLSSVYHRFSDKLYVQTTRPRLDTALAVRIEEAQEKDETMGHRTLAAPLSTGKNRIKRVVCKYGQAARRKRQKSVCSGKASGIAPKTLREEGMDLAEHKVMFFDILEIKLTDFKKGLPRLDERGTGVFYAPTRRARQSAPTLLCPCLGSSRQAPPGVLPHLRSIDDAGQWIEPVPSCVLAAPPAGPG